MNEVLSTGIKIEKAVAINLNLGQETINNINRLSASASNYKIIDYDVLRFNINRIQNITFPNPDVFKIDIEDIIKPLNFNVNFYKEIFSDFKMPRLLTQEDIENMLPKFDFNNINYISKVYTENLSKLVQNVNEQLKSISSAFNNTSNSFSIFQELQNRHTIISVSTVVVDGDVEDDYKDLWQEFVSFVIRHSPITFDYTIGITKAVITISEILTDSSNLMLLIFIYTHFKSIQKERKDKE